MAAAKKPKHAEKEKNLTKEADFTELIRIFQDSHNPEEARKFLPDQMKVSNRQTKSSHPIQCPSKSI